MDYPAGKEALIEMTGTVKSSQLAGQTHLRPDSGPRRALWLLGSVLATAILLSAEAGSASGRQIYRYVDANGVSHFTNVPNDSRYVPIPRSNQRRLRLSPSNVRYDGLIQLTARKHDLPPALIKAVIAAESNFQPGAISRKGAQGLMQLMPDTARSLGVEDPFHPSENVNGGTRYLRDLVTRYGDLDRALAAYNAGPRAVDRYGGVPPYPETRDYVARVLNYYRRYDGDFH